MGGWANHPTTYDTRVVHPSSVSNPIPPDLRAGYALIKAGPSGVRVTHHRVDYDRHTVIETLQRLQHPGRAFIIRHLRGEGKPAFGHPVLP